ncbi:hypothetical protein [Streptomyces sp. NPDC046939]
MDDHVALAAADHPRAHGDIDNFRTTLDAARLPFVPAIRPTRGA